MAAVAPRARAMTRDEWLTRAIEIADRDHLTFRAKWHQGQEQDAQVFSVPSRSQPNRYHIVRLRADGSWSCSCPANEHGLPCGHVGSAAHLWRQVAEAMTEAGLRAHQSYLDFCEWLETRGY